MVTPERDAFGEALKDWYAGKDACEIIERDDGYVEVGSGGMYALPFQDWSPHEQQAADYAHGRVLDAGCGAGRVCLHLQSIGIDCTGIDNSPGAVEVCRQRGVRDVRLLEFTQIDRALASVGKTSRLFDTIMMPGGNFGLFGSFKRARWMLRRLKGITTPDARIIAATLDPYATDRPEHLRYHERNRRRGRMGGQVRMRVRYRTYIGPWFDYLFVSQEELEAILDGTGWQVDSIIAEDGPSYTAVIRKHPRGR